jgi:putative N6-adenine-specific DNA methylase
MQIMYKYQLDGEYYAQIADGIEDLGAEEIASLNGKIVRIEHRGIRFEADQRTLYRIVYHNRLLARILAPLIVFTCYRDNTLYNKVKAIPWEDFLRPDQTLAVFAHTSNSKIDHSKYIALRVKDAIVDAYKERFGTRPSIDTEHPDLWVYINLKDNRAILSVDAGGGALHRRGYRLQTGEAPMIETIAAAIIRMSGWNGERPLYDPMCGSGTLLAEAMMQYCRIPAGYFRKRWGICQFPDYNTEQWGTLIREAEKDIKPLPVGLISGSDKDPQAIAQVRALPFPKKWGQIRVTHNDMFSIEQLHNYVIITNPPYGIRMQPESDMSHWYSRFGDFLKQRCTGSEAYIYFGNRAYIKQLGLHTSFKKPLRSGGLDGRLVKVVLF